MSITFNPQLKIASNVSFRAEAAPASPATAPVTTPAPAAPATTPVVEKQPIAPKKGLANFASKVSYAWINTTEMTKGAFKGLIAAAMTGTAIAGVDAVISGINKKAYKEIFTSPTKAMGAVGKYVAPVVAGMVFVGNLVSARLNANKRTANVDHQLFTNHRAEKK